MTLSATELINLTLLEIEHLLESSNKKLADFPPMPIPNMSVVSQDINRLVSEELNYDRVALAQEFLRLMSLMTSEQRAIYDSIMAKVNQNEGGLFFISGFGGSGKTFLWRALSAFLRSKGEIVLTVASSGIAALLIPGGRTAHSRFAIPLIVNECSTCNIPHGSPLAELIDRAKLIIWDEAPMTHRHCFEAVDRTFRDILKVSSHGSGCKPFGGKVVVLGGDFRQILPVIPKGTRSMIVNSTINSSYLWNHCKVMSLHTNMRLQSGSSSVDIQQRKKFSDWILAVGDGSIGEMNDDDIKLQIPPDLILSQSIDPLNSIVNSTYPSFLNCIGDVSYYQNRAILAPKNEVVNEINDFMSAKLLGEEHVYLSHDSVDPENLQSDRVENVHSTEFLNTISSSGLPNHIIKLKVGIPIMLLRNIDQQSGLCNGTRLLVTRLGKFVLEGKVISGTSVGQKVYIPRLSLTPSDVRIPFKFQRRQFPINISFAMTINKSQGQSLQNVGVFLRSPVFSHGQLYVAFSRVTSRDGLKVLIAHNDDPSSSETSNIVYKEVFTNLD